MRKHCLRFGLILFTGATLVKAGTVALSPVEIVQAVQSDRNDSWLSATRANWNQAGAIFSVEYSAVLKVPEPAAPTVVSEKLSEIQVEELKTAR
jgi:hypothetical protein